jgi:hypothetical protein
MTNNKNNPLVTEGTNGVRKAVGSPFLNGSFSGADIKVIVHLPINTSAIEMEQNKLDDEEQEIQRRLKQAQYYYGIAQSSGRDVSSDFNRIQDLEQRLKSLNDRRGAIVKIKENGHGSLTKTLATIQTISWSIYREKVPVRFLGSVYARSYVRGSRTIAGSMIFTMFDQHAFRDVLDWGLSPYSTGHVESDHDYYRDTTVLIDQLPPLDITLLFANEYGAISYMNLWGVEFISEGATHSIEDLFSESVVQYVARDIDPIREDIKRETDLYTNSLTGKIKPKNASQLRAEDLDISGSGVNKRRNPYI